MVRSAARTLTLLQVGRRKLEPIGIMVFSVVSLRSAKSHNTRVRARYATTRSDRGLIDSKEPIAAHRVAGPNPAAVEAVGSSRGGAMTTRARFTTCLRGTEDQYRGQICVSGADTRVFGTGWGIGMGMRWFVGMPV